MTCRVAAAWGRQWDRKSPRAEAALLSVDSPGLAPPSALLLGSLEESSYSMSGRLRLVGDESGAGPMSLGARTGISIRAWRGPEGVSVSGELHRHERY